MTRTYNPNKVIVTFNGKPITGFMTDSIPMWDLDESIALQRKIEQELAPAGWHAALTGGVLRNGSSMHDLDIVVFPHCRKSSQRPRMASLRAALERAGLKLRMSRRELQAHWRKNGSLDTKWVEIWKTAADGRRVDIMVLS